MNRRFIKLVESNISRYTNGGLLVGDVVKLRPNAINHPDFETNEELKITIRSLMSGGLNLRVVNIKNKRPAVMGGNNDDTIIRRNALVDIAQEIAPGRYHNYVTVPIEVLTVVSGNRPEKDQSPEHFNDVQPDINLPEVPGKLKHHAKINIKPKPPEKPSEDNEFSIGHQTLKSDQGGKIKTGDRELLNTNTQIPSSPAVKHRDPAAYTAMYLPKK